MFMGVGILKVKGLFRKLRQLALRYGGVIVFFDEADSLGNRGAMQPGPLGGAAGASPWSVPIPPCNGLSYLSDEATATLLRAGLTAGDAEEPPRRHRDRIFMGGMGGGGGGGMGTLQALLAELSGLKKPRGFVNRYVRRLLGMRPEAAAQVPHPRDDGHEHAPGARRGAAAARAASTASTRSATRRRRAASARTRATSTR